MKHDNPELIIDRIIDKVGKDLVVGTPLALGKPNHLLNALYNRVKNNPESRSCAYLPATTGDL